MSVAVQASEALSAVSLFTPSVKLMNTQHLSEGHAILPQCVQYLSVSTVANLSTVPIWLDQVLRWEQCNRIREISFHAIWKNTMTFRTQHRSCRIMT